MRMASKIPVLQIVVVLMCIALIELVFKCVCFSEILECVGNHCVVNGQLSERACFEVSDVCGLEPDLAGDQRKWIAHSKPV